jgi:ketosteroid isomerase-like protein
MKHPYEELLRTLYRLLNTGDLEGFLAGCADDATFAMPGNTAVSGTYSKATYRDVMESVVEESQGRFQQHLLEVAANDQHGIVLLFHRFRRGGRLRSYRTAHIVTFGDRRITAWQEHPGSMAEFETAWADDQST